MKEAAETTCLYVEDEFNPLKRMHDNRRCRKHYLERRCARMRIGIHEDFLPSDDMVCSIRSLLSSLLAGQHFNVKTPIALLSSGTAREIV